MSPDEFKNALACWASGVSVVTVDSGGLLYGLTVSSFSSVSLEPPLVLVCINRHNRIVDMISAAGHFAVSVLREEQRDASVYFSTPGREPTGGFVEIEGEWSARGQPIVKGALAHVVCELHTVADGGDHAIVVGRVVHAEADDTGRPLLYFQRDYCTLA